VRRSTLLVFALLLTLTVGLTLQPDDGTAMSRPAGVGLKVDGANHAKPLPRVVSVHDLRPVLSVSVIILIALAAGAVQWLRRREDVPIVRFAVLARVIARRGPPALA
jgi:hypothetical protein